MSRNSEHGSILTFQAGCPDIRLEYTSTRHLIIPELGPTCQLASQSRTQTPPKRAGILPGMSTQRQGLSVRFFPFREQTPTSAGVWKWKQESTKFSNSFAPFGCQHNSRIRSARRTGQAQCGQEAACALSTALWGV